jgi:hypothetical protein
MVKFTDTVRDLYRGISDFKKGYQARTNVVKDEKGDVVADSRSILARWRKRIFEMLNYSAVNIHYIVTHVKLPIKTM